MKGKFAADARKSLCILLILFLVITTIPTSDISLNSLGEDRTRLEVPLVPPLENPSNNHSPSEERTRGWTNATNQMVINELMVFLEENGKWIEIYNGAEGPVSLDDWMISDEDGLTYEFSGLPDMPSGSYLILHFEKGESDTYIGQTQPNALHVYTGWQNVRWTRHEVDTDIHYARVAAGYDIMENGQPEILANRFGGNSILFYEPQADMTQEWILSEIAGTGGIHRLKPIDVDSDTHVDMVYNLYFGNEGGNDYSIRWMKAPATTPKDPWLGPYDIAKIRRPEGLDAGNINGDNLADVVVGSKWTDQIYWFESPVDPMTPGWPQHDIDINFNQPGDMELVDLDGDADLDLVAVGSYGEEVAWYEHPANPVNPWTKHTIAPLAGQSSPPTCSEFDATGELYVGDVDGDAKPDVVVSEAQRNRIVWYKYNIGPTGAWTEYIIDDNISAPSGLDVGDIDNDGDNDVIASSLSGFIAWYPQPPAGQQYDPNWLRYVVDDMVHMAFYVNATDLDMDGDLDIVSADQGDNRILWFENEFLEFSDQDQAALHNSTVPAPGNIIDFVAWGAPSLTEDDIAVAAGIWQDEEFVDTILSGLNQTFARDRHSTDTNATGDWDVVNGADSDIPTMGTVNYPYPIISDLRVEYDPFFFKGGTDSPEGDPLAGMPDGLVLANYSGFTFKVDVGNPWGWRDLENVELTLDPGGANVSFIWTRIDGNFSIFDASDYITLISECTNASTDGVYDWQVNFTIFFHWWYPTEGFQDASITTQNTLGYSSTVQYIDCFQVVKTLKMVDTMLVYDPPTGPSFGAGGWVRPSMELEVSGPVVIYDVQTDRYYPGEGEFNVILSDNLGNDWVDYTSAGHPVRFTINVPEDATTGLYNLTLTIADLRIGAAGLNELMHQLNVDADLPQFDDPSPSYTVWQTSSSIQCGIRTLDSQPGSNIAGDTIQYRLANGSTDRFGDWIPAPLPGSNDVMNPQVACGLPEGSDNWIQWRAKDVAGNGPSVSNIYRIPVDSEGITYQEFYPPSTIVQQGDEIIVNITLADFEGSGVNISTFELAVKSSGVDSYTDWFVPEFEIINQTLPVAADLPSGPETVRLSVAITGLSNGNGNYIKFRARDIAGNAYTVSDEYNIRVSAGHTPGEDNGERGLLDYSWIIVLIIMIIILVIITYFNRKRTCKEEDGARRLESDLIK